MTRSLSFTEISTALTCQAQHAFRYTGHLTGGDALKPKLVIPRLRAGRAWGAAVAAWHANQSSLFGYAQATTAMDQSLEADAERQRSFGVHDEAEHERLRGHLRELLAHYVQLETDPLQVAQLEHELEVAIPSRRGRRSSNRYHFQAFFDAVTSDWRPWETWLVEYKLRDTLSPYELVANSRQIRWYAWTYQHFYGVPVHGVIVDERLSMAPRPARLVKAKRKGEGIDGRVPSHAVDQLTTPELYVDLCRRYNVEPQEGTLLVLKARRWSLRHPVMFRAGELDEAGLELVSAAKLIRDLDSGETLPIRNVKPQNCNGCSFREICPAPDSELVDALYERTPPKRLRSTQEEASL